MPHQRGKRLPKILMLLATVSLGFECCATVGLHAQKRMPFVDVMRLSGRPDGLHKAALANGGRFYSEKDTPGRADGPAPDLSSLTRFSPLIVLGRVTSSHTELANEGREINTVYTIAIDHVFKGVNPG
jgi:hypothetical protein